MFPFTSSGCDGFVVAIPIFPVVPLTVSLVVGVPAEAPVAMRKSNASFVPTANVPPAEYRYTPFGSSNGPPIPTKPLLFIPKSPK